MTDAPIYDAGYESLVSINLDGENEISVLVRGVHCAGCIQKIESTLKADPSIQTARLNFSTNRLSFSWNGDAERVNTYIQSIENLGYIVSPYDSDIEQSESKNEERFLLLCLGIAGFAMGNIMLLSFGLWMTTAETMGTATRDLMHWIQAIIALPTILFAGRPFFRSAVMALRNHHTNMDVPISLALCLAGAMSLYETMRHGEHVYFDSALMLMFFLLIGRYLDFRARKRARSAATDLLSTFVGFANVIEGDNVKRILIRDLTEGMFVRVAAGEKFPVDGIIDDGNSTIDTALITGETMPRDITEDSDVFAGTINLSSSVIVKVVKAAEDSLLANIVRLMEKAGQGQAAYVRVADKAAKLYTPVVHTFALLAFLWWYFIGDLVWQDALMIAVTVLIITCPCALGLAVPVVQVLATGRLMKSGVLVKAGDALERLARIDTIFFDKTGTLTLGRPQLVGLSNKDDLKVAASVAIHSRHPLSQALVEAYGGSLLTMDKVEEISGKGLIAEYDGKSIRLGSRNWCGNQSISPSKGIELWLNIDGKSQSVFYFEDQLRIDTLGVLTQFNKRGLKTIMLSGDRSLVVGNIAAQCGIETVYAEKTPVEKFNIVEEEKEKGYKVLMVGDGLNDAPSLAAADVSIAPGTAIDMAQNAADIVFMGDKLAPIYEAYNVASKTQTLVKQNFGLAILYNIIAVPLALSGMVTPLIAAIAMSGSSLIVIANSFRLKFLS